MRQIFTFFIFILSFNLSAIPHDAKFYKGADAIVAKGGLPGFYQPSQRFPLIQAIQNYRFLGNQGNWNPKIPVHVQSISADENPQTFVDSLIQLLFPSPDDVNLTPNQAESDPLSRLSIDNIIALINFSKNSDTSEDDLRLELFPNLQISDAVRENYDEFLKYEFARQIKVNLDAISESAFESHGVDQTNVNWRSEFVQSHYTDLFGLNRLKVGDIEKTAAGSRYAKLKGLKKTSKKQQQEMLVLESELGQDAAKFVFFEENREALLTYRFLDTFLRALKEDNTLIDQPIEKALLTYMWMKFKSSDERVEFYEKIGVTGLKEIFEEKTYTFNDYLNLRRKFDEHTTLLKKIERKKQTISKFENELEKLTQRKGKRRHVNSRKAHLSQILPELRQGVLTLEKRLDEFANFMRQLSPEELALLKYGYELYEMPNPDIIPYGHATVMFKDKPQTFPDCVESSILSLLLNKARIYKDGRYQIDAAQFPEESPLHHFFKEIKSPLDFYAPETHNRFAELLRNLKLVKYLKPGGSQNGTYEVKPGLINSLHVFGNLIPELSGLLEIDEKSSHDTISQGLDRLTHYLFGENGSWQAQTIDDFSKEIVSNDIYSDIIFKHKLNNIYKWAHEDGHATLSKLFSAPAVFSKEMLNYMSDPLKLGFVGLDDESRWHFYYDPLNQTPTQFVTTASYDSAHTRRLGIERIFDWPKDARLKPMGYSLLREQREEDDDVAPEDTQDSFANILYNMSKKLEASISKDEYRHILTHALSELNGFVYDWVLPDVADRVYLVNQFLRLGFRDILLEKAEKSHKFAMTLSSLEDRAFFDEVINKFQSLIDLNFYVSHIEDLKETLEKHANKISKIEYFRIDFKNLNVSSNWFLDWIKALKNNFHMQVDALTYETEEQLQEFFKGLYQVQPNVTIFDDNLEENHQKLLRGLKPKESNKDEVEL